MACCRKRIGRGVGVGQMTYSLSSIMEIFLSSIMGIVLGILFTRIQDFFRIQKPIRIFWGDFLKKPVRVIYPSLRDSDELPVHTGRSCPFAATEVCSLLASYHSKKSEGIKILETKYVRDLDHNIVLIGGPKANNITKNILDHSNIPITFVDNSLLDLRHEKILRPRTEKNRILEDYALILRMANPYNTQKHLVVIAGCYGYGSYAGALALTSPEILSDISKRTKCKSIGIIVKSHVIHETPQKPAIIEIFDL